MSHASKSPRNLVVGSVSFLLTPTFSAGHTFTILLHMSSTNLTSVPPSDGHQPRCVDLGSEKRYKIHTRDRSQTCITDPGDVPPFRCPTPQEPDVDKKLPDIPSVSMGLWGSGPVLEILRTEVPKQVSYLAYDVFSLVSPMGTVGNFDVLRE